MCETQAADERGSETQPKSLISQLIEEQQIHTVVIGAVDLNGVMRGKRLPVRQFLDTGLEHGVGFSDCLLVTDFGCEFAPDVVGGLSYYPTAETGFPDIRVIPDLTTFLCVPWEPGVATVMGDFRFEDGKEVDVGPRQILKRAIARCEALGYSPYVGVEFEFHVFAEEYDELYRRGFRDMRTIAAKPYTYSSLRSALDDHLFYEVRRAMKDLGIFLEGSNAETGRGQYEINLRYAAALQAADEAIRFKESIKELLAKQGHVACFMAKVGTEESGSSGHIHASLRSSDGTNAFWDGNKEFHMSDVLRSFVAGQLATMSAFMPMFCPTVNSYKRLLPESWSGTTETWDIGNRGVALRLIMDSESGARVEHRVPGADTNPYLAIAALLLGGAWGIENNLELPPRTTGNIYARADVTLLPRSLEEAVNVMSGSTVAKELLGADVLGFFLNSRHREVDAYRSVVTDYEVRRYFDEV